MKRLALLIFILTVIVFAGCKKNSSTAAPSEPSAPDATMTITQTATNVVLPTMSATVSPTPTVTESTTTTMTMTITQTSTTTSTATATCTLTSTNTPVHEYVLQYGSSGSMAEQFARVQGMCVDENGYIYHADTDNRMIKVYDIYGNTSGYWGIPIGTGVGEISYPYGICYDGSEYFYVSDAGKYKLLKINKSNVIVAEYGSVGVFESEPHDLFYKDGIIYVLCTSGKVVKYQADGTYVSSIGTYGTGAGQLNNPHGLYVDAAGNIYVGSLSPHKVVKYDSTGVFVTKWEHNWPAGIIMDNGGNLVITSASSSVVRIYSTSGVYINQFGGYDYAGTGLGLFLEPFAITKDSQGNIYISDTSLDIVQKFTK